MDNKLKSKKQILNGIDKFLKTHKLNGIINSAKDAKKNILDDSLFYSSVINYFEEFNKLFGRLIGTTIQKNEKYDEAKAELKELKDNLCRIALIINSSEDNKLSTNRTNAIKNLFIGYESEKGHEKGYLEQVHNYIDSYFDLEEMRTHLQEYRESRKGKKENKIKTLAGKTKTAIKNNGKKIIIGGSIVVLATGIILLATHCEKNKNENGEKNNDNTKPSTSQTDTLENVPSPSATPTNTPVPTIEPTVMPTPTNLPEQTAEPTAIPTPINTPEPVDKIHESALKAYASWSKITDNYSVNDIENVIKALYGLDSTLTLDEADGVIKDVIELATIPRINNLLMGIPCDAKQVDVVSLLQTRSNEVETMQDIFNSALTIDNIRETAVKALNEEVQAYEYGLLDNLDAASKIIWARLAIYVNGIHGTLGSDFYYNQEFYSQGEMLESSIYENILSKAKSQGPTRIK